MSRSATTSDPEENGLVYRPWVWRRVPLQAIQSNRDVALRCNWSRFQRSGAIKPNPDPASRGRLAPTSSGRPRVLPVGGRPRCRRSGVHNHETLNRANRVGKHLILGQFFVQRSRTARRASLSGLATFLRPREEGPVLTPGKREMRHPKVDRPVLSGQHLGARDDEIYQIGKRHNTVHRESPSLPMPFRPFLDCRTSLIRGV